MKTKQNRNKTWQWQVLFGVMLSLSVCWGYQLEQNDHLELKSIGMWIWFAALSVAFSLAAEFLRKKLPLVKLKSSKNGYTKKEFGFVWALLALGNFVVLLGVYPGFFVYDAQTEVMEVLTRSFSTHHPLLHVLLLGGSVAFFHKFFGSYNLGIFTYIFAQMLVMTWIFTYLMNFMKKNGAGKLFRRITGVFFACFPTVVMYTLCSCKDGLFSSFLVLTVILIIEFEEERSATRRKKKLVHIIISATLMMLFRHNGFYAYMVFSILVAILPVLKKTVLKAKKQRLIFLMVPLILYVLISGILSRTLAAESGEHQEMLTVPLQQIARVYYYEKDSFSKEELDILHRYLSSEGLSHYTPRLSDILKLYFDNAAYEQDKASFWKLWAETGIKHPMSYLNAWFLTSYGFWYPGAVINVYQGNTVFTFTYTDSSYFGYEVELPGERQSLIPIIDRVYRKLSIGKFQQNIPVISLLFSPAAYFWAAVLLFMIYLDRSNKAKYPFLLLLLVWLTVLLGPTYLVRYCIYLWYIIPVLLLLSMRQVEEL